MSLRLVFNVTTLVVVAFVIWSGAATAKVHTHSPDQPPPKSSEEDQNKIDLEEQNLTIVQPPPANPEVTADLKNAYYYPYQQSLTPRVGFVLRSEEDDRISMLYGLQYMLRRFVSPRLEMGIDYLSSADLHVNAGIRYIFYEKSFFRPYYKFGLTHQADPSDLLATFLDSDNYYLRSSFGMEDVIVLPRSVRFEAEFAIGLKDWFLAFSGGYSWAW